MLVNGPHILLKQALMDCGHDDYNGFINGRRWSDDKIIPSKCCRSETISF